MAAPTDPMELLNLKRGWDSYDALPPDPATVGFANTIGQRMASLFSFPASYVPCNGGEVQIEWHGDGWDVEVYISRRTPTGDGGTQ